MSNIDNWVDEFFSMNPDAAPVEQPTKTKKENTLSLTVELPSMDFRKKNFYRDLSDEHKKEISIWVLMRFMSSSQNDAEHHIMLVNDLVNQNFNSLTKHPELQWKLLSMCGTNKKQYHPWIPPPRGIKKNKLEEAFLKHYSLIKDDDLELLFRINTEDDFKQFFKENGYDDKTIKDLFKNENKEK